MAQYESYKDCGVKWLGQIPSHWKVKRYKHLFFKRSMKGNSLLPLLCSTQKYGVIPQSTYENRVVTAIKGLEGLKLVEKGDFVISLRSFQGGIEYAHYKGIISPAYTILCPNDSSNSQYFRYLLKCPSTLSLLASMVTGIRQGQNIDYNRLKYDFLPIPPMNEQEAIVAYLDKVTAEIDRAIEAQQKMIDALNERKQIIITRAVTSGLNPNAPLRDSGIDWLGQIPAHWDFKKLKAIADIKGRIGFRGYTNSDLVEQGDGAITLSPSNIINGKMSYHKCSYLSWHKYYESPEIMVENGHILFVKTGSSYGKTAFVTDLPMEATINPQFSLINPKGVDSYFLNFAISSQYFKLQVERGVIGSTIPTISQSAIGSMLVLMPPHNEQLEITKYLNSLFVDLDSLIVNCERMISLLQERKQIIINEVVTGKKKVI